MKTIVIGCDNAAVSLKNVLINFLKEKDIAYKDVGVHSEDDQSLYPDIASLVAREVIDSGYQKRGILLCGTGIGMAMTANKFRGIRAAVCHDLFSVERSVLSNDANVLAMGARIIAPQYAQILLEHWLDLEFVDGSSTPKVERMEEIEKENFR